MIPTADHRANLEALFRSAPIATAMGMSFSYDDEHRAVFDLPRNPDFDHAMGDVHGGAIATLIDNAAWFTAAAHYETWLVTVELTIRLLEPPAQPHLTAIGRLEKAGKRIAVASAEVSSTDGRLVAIGTGTFTPTGRRYDA